MTFSRESLLSSLRTFLWVVPLTILIWIYAEREQLGPPQKVEFTIQPRNADPTRWVSIIEPANGRLSADLSGPRGRLEEVQRQLATPSYPIEFPRMDPGIHTIQASVVGNDPVFANNGITAGGFVPRDLTLSVDLMVTVKVNVQVRPEVRDNLEKVEFDPRTVEISVPETFRKDHPALTVYAELQDLSSPGIHEENAALAPSVTDPRSHIAISRPKVHASYTVKETAITGHIPSIGVWPKIPPLPNNFWGTHHVEFQNGNDTLRNVGVSGPPQEINKVINPNSGVKATFDVNSTDPSAGFTEAPVKFEGLPEGVKLESKDWKIFYKVVENTPP